MDGPVGVVDTSSVAAADAAVRYRFRTARQALAELVDAGLSLNRDQADELAGLVASVSPAKRRAAK